MTAIGKTTDALVAGPRVDAREAADLLSAAATVSQAPTTAAVTMARGPKRRGFMSSPS